MRHRCSKEELKALKRNVHNVLLSDYETREPNGFLIALVSAMEAVLLFLLIKFGLEELLPETLWAGLLLSVVYVILYAVIAFVLRIINVFAAFARINVKRRRYFLKWSDITINGADLIKNDIPELSYVEDGMIDEKSRPIIVAGKYSVNAALCGKDNARLVIIRGKNELGKPAMQIMLASEELKKYIGESSGKNYKHRDQSRLKKYPHLNAEHMNGQEQILQGVEKERFEYLYRNKLFIQAFRKGICFLSKKEVLFCKVEKGIDDLKYIQVYELEKEEYILKKYYAGLAKYEFEYGEILYKLVNPKGKVFFLAKQEVEEY